MDSLLTLRFSICHRELRRCQPYRNLQSLTAEIRNSERRDAGIYRYRPENAAQSLAKVISNVDLEGNAVASGKALYDGTIHTVGDTVRPDNYDDLSRVECAPGINFCITSIDSKFHRRNGPDPIWRLSPKVCELTRP